MADAFPEQGGLVGQFPLEQWFYEMPVCTRYWTTATVITSILVQCHVVSPFSLFYSLRTVWYKSEYWRLLTTFLYFGPLSLDLVFHVFFLSRYARLLEEGSGRSPAPFAWLLVYASSFLLLISTFLSIHFLGSSLSSTLVYIWSRRNPDTLLNFLGFLVFKAPWLPWVLMAFSFVVHGVVPRDEICGVVVGHVWYYFNDIYPRAHSGHRPFDPPAWWVRLFERRQPPQQPADADADAEDDEDDGRAEPETRGQDVHGEIAAAAR